jgi:nitrogen fixation protein NifU and related proteins
MTQGKSQNPGLQGGAMGGVEELYREVILDHFKSPRNKGALPNANAHADGMNPLCGDQITVSAVVDNGVIRDIKFDGHGCAISQSSASMMTDAIKGKNISDALKVSQAFKKIFGIEGEASIDTSSVEIGDMEALEGVKKYPVRIKCAVLSWNTFLEALKNLK